MEKAPPIQVNHLFKVLDDKLIELLSSLTEEEWHRPTIAKLWTVKDIAAHLLDGNIRGVSIQRDRYLPGPPANIQSYKDLIDYLNKLNADWVDTMKRASPQMIIALLQSTSGEFMEAITSLPPYEKAMFSVAWAGEEQSDNWFHVAREYTEKFIHQQQIRDAVGKEGLITKELFYPFIDTFMQGMPYTFRNTIADEGATVQIRVTSDAGGEWFVTRANNKWQLSKNRVHRISSTIVMDPGITWKLFSKGITPQEAKPFIAIQGNIVLAETALNLVAVMA